MKKKKRGSRKFRRFNIQVHLTNRWLYTFIVLGILAIVGVGVWAAVDTTKGWHPASQIDFTSKSVPSSALATPTTGCISGQFLKYDGTNWVCSAVTLTETDPQVGTVTSNQWCIGDGSAVQCNQNTPILSETDPTVKTWAKTDNPVIPGTLTVSSTLLYGYEIKKAGGSSTSCTATCSTGKKVVGGGCDNVGTSGDNYPSGDNAWKCTGSLAVTCYAICARVGA